MKSPVKKTNILICCLFYMFIHANAESIPPHEIAEKIAAISANTDKSGEAAKSLFNYYHRTNKIDSVAIYAKKVVELGKEKNNAQLWIEGYIQLAMMYMHTAHQDSVSHFLNLVLSETDHSNSSYMGKARATALMLSGANANNQEEAFYYFNQAIENAKQYKNTHVYIRSSIALINNLFERKRYDKVNDILTDAYQYIEENKSEYSVTLRILNKVKARYLALTATTKEERKEALKLMLNVYEKADSLNLEMEKMTIFIDIALYLTAEMPKQEMTEMAELNFNAFKDKISGSLKGGLYQAYGHVLLHSQNYKKAIPYLKVSKEYLFSSRNMENYLSVCEDLIVAYEQTNQLDKIVPEFQDYKNFRDSLEATVYSDQLLDLEEKYETEKKENENAQLMAQNNIINTRFRLSSIIGFLLFGLLATRFYFFQKLKRNKKQLERMNEEKNKLFVILAHDLRNPIASLSNLSGKVKFLTKNNRLHELDEMAMHTDAKLNALNDNLNNILLWAVKESNLVKVKPVRVSLQTEINKINELYTDAISQKNIIINNSISASTYVQTDLTVLQTIIRNLISNAIKFSKQGGSIEYSVANKKDWIELNIIDNGIGLNAPKDELESPNNSSIRKKAKGSGIGLKICKELAAKSNLELNLTPNPKGGTIGIIRFRKAA